MGSLQLKAVKKLVFLVLHQKGSKFCPHLNGLRDRLFSREPSDENTAQLKAELQSWESLTKAPSEFGPGLLTLETEVIHINYQAAEFVIICSLAIENKYKVFSDILRSLRVAHMGKG